MGGIPVTVCGQFGAQLVQCPWYCTWYCMVEYFEFFLATLYLCK